MTGLNNWYVPFWQYRATLMPVHANIHCLRIPIINTELLGLTSRRLSLVMRHADSAQSESPVPDRRLYRKGVGSSTSSPVL